MLSGSPAQVYFDCVLQVIVDTSGWAFMYPLFRLAGAKVASYTHYPTISTDMLQRVTRREATYNNDASVAGSPLKSLVKVIYYHILAAAYGAVGGCANVGLRSQPYYLHNLQSAHLCETSCGTQFHVSAAVTGGDGKFQLDPPAHITDLVDLNSAIAGVPTLQCQSPGSPSTGPQAEVPVPGLPGPISP